MYFTLPSTRFTPVSKSPVSSHLKSQPVKAQPRFGGLDEVNYWLHKLQKFKPESIKSLARIQRHTNHDELTVAEELGSHNPEIAWYVEKKKALLHQELVNKKMEPALSQYYRTYHRALQQAVETILVQNGYKQNGFLHSRYTQTAHTQTTAEPCASPRSRFIITDLNEEEKEGTQAQPSATMASSSKDTSNESPALIQPVPFRPKESPLLGQQSSLKRTTSGTFRLQDSMALLENQLPSASMASLQIVPDTLLLERPLSPVLAEDERPTSVLPDPVFIDEPSRPASPSGINASLEPSEPTGTRPFPRIELFSLKPEERKESIQHRRTPERGLSWQGARSDDFPMASRRGLHQSTASTPLLEQRTAEVSSTDVNCLKIVQDFCSAILSCLLRRNSEPATRVREANAAPSTCPGAIRSEKVEREAPNIRSAFKTRRGNSRSIKSLNI